MKRREFINLASMTTVLAGVGGSGLLRAASVEVQNAIASSPVLQNPAPDGISVLIAVRTLSTGWVEYGETDALGRRALGSAQGLMPLDERILKFRLTGLRPGTRYFYRVHVCPVSFKNAYDIQRGEAICTPLYRFSTLDPQADTTSFSVINDTHEVRETLVGLGSLLRANPTDSLIWAGDIFNDIRTEQQIVEQVLNPGGQDFASQTPLILARGNHDVRGVKARLLDRYFDLPTGLWYYTLRQGPVAFLVMDTGEDKSDASPVYAGLNDFDRYRTEQQQWLPQAIQRPEFRSAPFRVAILHIPLLWKDYTQPGWHCPDAKAKWHDLLVKGRVNLVISGHTHEPAWFPPGAEAPYAQLVGGGPRPEAATLIKGVASNRELRLAVHNLAGKELGVYVIQV